MGGVDRGGEENIVLMFLDCRINVSCGPSEDRILMTGLHTVRDMFCNVCHASVGWKYVRLVGVMAASRDLSVDLGRVRTKRLKSRKSTRKASV